MNLLPLYIVLVSRFYLILLFFIYFLVLYLLLCIVLLCIRGRLSFCFSLGHLQFCAVCVLPLWRIKILYTPCSKKSDAKIQITITTAYLTRIKYPLSGFNCHLSDVNIANFNKIYRTVSEQQLF